METEAINALAASPLGDGASQNDMAAFLMSGWVKQTNYRHGEMIFRAGEVPTRFFLLVSGSVIICQETPDGQRLFASEFETPGDLIGETALFRAPLPYEFSAEAKSDTLLLEIARGLFTNSERGGATARIAVLITRNLLRLFATKNVRLERRGQILSGETLRQKIARFLLLPPTSSAVGRDILAEYLVVPPSALARELETMQAEGLISLAGRIIKIGDQAGLVNCL